MSYRAAMLRYCCLLLAAGCAVSTDKASPAGVDSAASLDSGEPVDSGGPVDTGDSEPVTVSGTVELPESTSLMGVLGVSAVHLVWNEGAVTLGLALDSGVVDEAGEFSLTLPAQPPENHRTALSPSDHPDVIGAMYALPVFVPDAPEAPVFYEGQVIRGLPFDRYLLWLDPSTLGDTGWPGGWSLVDTGMAGSYAPPLCHLGSSQPLTWRWEEGYPVFYEVDSTVSVRLRGLPAALELGGSVDGEVSARDRLAAIPQQVASGAETGLAPLADMDLSTGSFSATLTAAPDPSYDSSGDPDWRSAMALLLRYTDDGDGQWSLELDGPQTTLQTACDGRRPAYLRYTREVSTWTGMRLLDCYEAQVGWRLVTLDEATRAYAYLDDAASRRLRVDSTCSF